MTKFQTFEDYVHDLSFDLYALAATARNDYMTTQNNHVAATGYTGNSFLYVPTAELESFQKRRYSRNRRGQFNLPAGLRIRNSTNHQHKQKSTYVKHGGRATRRRCMCCQNLTSLKCTVCDVFVCGQKVADSECWNKLHSRTQLHVPRDQDQAQNDIQGLEQQFEDADEIGVEEDEENEGEEDYEEDSDD